MATLESSGTQSATIGTEHTLATLTGAKVYVLVVDTVNLANGDELLLRVKTMLLSAGTSREAYSAGYAHTQGQPIKLSIPVPSDQEYIATLEQTAGTGRSFDWKVLSI